MTTLRSVAEQSHPATEWECVVVDNNSSDDTRHHVEIFCAEHPALQLHYLFEEKQGLSYARNAGIAASRGEVVAFIDDDERIVEDFVGAYVDFFAEHPEAVAAGGKIVAEYPTGRPTWMSRYTEQPIANPMDFGDKVSRFPSGRIPGGGNMAMHRILLDEVGVFNTSLGRTGKRLIGGEESELFERIADKGYEWYYVPRAVMYHIIPSEKLTEEYFERLALNTGRSQRMRAELRGRVTGLYIREVMKWVATLLLCLVHRPAQSRYLIRLRRGISKGVFQRD